MPKPAADHAYRIAPETLTRLRQVRTGSGLADYRVLNLIDRTLEVYREPVTHPTAPFGWRYARRETVTASGRVAPLAAPAAFIAVSDLLA